MGFFRTRFIGAFGPYVYFEERWREDGKVKSRSTMMSGPSSAARRAYHEALAQNVYTFGTSRPGARYQAEAEARAAYLRQMDYEKYLQSPEHARALAEHRAFNSPAAAKERAYKASYPSPQYKAHSQYLEARSTVREEDRHYDALERGRTPGDTPTDEDEALHAQWSENQRAERDELNDENVAWMNAEDATAQDAEASSPPDPNIQGE